VVKGRDCNHRESQRCSSASFYDLNSSHKSPAKHFTILRCLNDDGTLVFGIGEAMDQLEFLQGIYRPSHCRLMDAKSPGEASDCLNMITRVADQKHTKLS
jgi:hypothetical protein